MTAFGWETVQLGRRTMRRFYRVPANTISILVFPLIQLVVFSQLYRDIVTLPGFESAGGSYLAYLAPGQVAFTAFLAVSWSGTGLVVDWRTGFLDKLRVAPIARTAILAGEVVPVFFGSAAMAAVVLAASVVLGADIATGIGGAVAITLLAGGLGVAWSGTSFLPALLTRSEQATGTLSMMLFPIAFMSTAFVPVALMPEWLQIVNDWNPITHVIEAIRALMVSGWDAGLLGRAVASLALFGGTLHLATLWAFRRLTA